MSRRSRLTIGIATTWLAVDGWAYAVFDCNRASDTFAPDKPGIITCGFACYTRVANKDDIFTAYGKR